MISFGNAFKFCVTVCFLLIGDDQSEGSESTSGCSSLIPQANRQFQAGENAVNSFLGRRRSIDEKLNCSK
jgi:hypothetical protein